MTETRRVNRLVIPIAAVLGIGGLITIGALTFRHGAGPAGLSPDGPRVLATLPEFVLADERGASLDLYDLRGTVWVADFIFTRCRDTCPLITRQMGGLAKEVAATPALKDVKLVSFSVDPAFDQPDVLREYGRANGADPAHWTFLTGTREAVRGLVRDGFKLPVGDQDDPKMPIFHSQHFALIDRDGRVRGAFNALTEEGRRDLRAALTKVLAERAEANVFVPADVADEKWFAERRAVQTTAAGTIGVPHDFQFVDRIGASGITFRHGNSTDVGKEYRATHYDHGTAVAVADVDGDGLLDLYFVNQLGKNALYRSLGGGRL